MVPDALPTSSVGLADRIRRDIVRRGLRPGDKYFSTREAAVHFRVPFAAAVQAMRELTALEVLVRRDRSGTFVGRQLAPHAELTIRSVAILLPEARAASSSVSFDGLIHALRHLRPHLIAQVAFLPREAEMNFVRELLEIPPDRQHAIGIVAISCSREIYSYLERAGLPLVILGTPDLDLAHLPHVDVDAFEAGRLLANHLIAGGHRRLALLHAHGDRGGDEAFQRGILEAMFAAELPANTLTTRRVSSDLDLFRAQALSLVRREEPPSGIICRVEELVAPLLDVLQNEGGHDGCEVVYEHVEGRLLRRGGLVYVRPKLRPPEIYAQVAERLAAQISREATIPLPYVVPVELAREPLDQPNEAAILRQTRDEAR